MILFGQFGGNNMKNILVAILFGCAMWSFSIGDAFASVQAGYIGDGDKYNLTYPIVEIAENDDKKNERKINEDILAQVNELKTQTENRVYSKTNMTYYEKYEDDNIVSLMFYVNSIKRFSNDEKLSGYTITYDKHTGERVPMQRYLNITLPQLQNALNHSMAYTVNGLDNGVNLDKAIPYVSDNYFICHDGSIGLLYQPGDLMDEDIGACKIVVSPETIAEVNRINGTIE